ncbi:hypothetical protein HOI26_03830 [Candidatus Woesearchaeota archaeon]|nr:hypothetical protein [Candidatus Woesearchaeota archaeon]MBT5740205.1 hypothetical protein [Candidatus Woesearchaeota archaeon]
MQKRGAISLSINFIVTVIISLVILALGLVLLGKFIGGAEEIQGNLDHQTDQRLEYLLVDQGKKVALPFHEATIFRDESHTFGVGMLNINEEQSFTINVEPDLLNGEEITDSTITDWLLYNDQPIKLKEQEHHKEPILISIVSDALTGQYQFKVKVTDSSGEQYGNTQRIIVQVK